jgi:predicted GNAT superfamily acetyltransferase
MLTFVRASTTAECTELVDLFDRIWGSDVPGAVVDLGVVVALASSGNPVTLARLDDETVGGALGFFGPPGAPLHSHVVGVLPGAARRGLGREIKLDQRQWTLEHDVHRMTWTYDPLIARNAHFNIVKLGALPVRYHPDHYGPMNDGLNLGQPSDRLLVEWDLDPEPGTEPIPPGSGHLALDNAGERPGAWTAPPAAYDGPVRVGIPRDIESLRRSDPGLATAWRQETRLAFTRLLDEGWRVTGFDRDACYVLTRESTRSSMEGAAL